MAQNNISPELIAEAVNALWRCSVKVRYNERRTREYNREI